MQGGDDVFREERGWVRQQRDFEVERREVGVY